MGSRGLESEFRFARPWGYFNVSYSYYQSYKSDAQTYMAGHGSNSLIGFARNQIFSNLNVKMSDTLQLNTFLTMLGKRYGYSTLGTDGTPELRSFDPVVLANLYLSEDLKSIPGLQLGVGLYNFLGTSFKYIQPSNGGHAPLPGLEPEVLLKLNYAF